MRSEFQGVEVKRGRRYKNLPLDPPHRPLEMASESNSSGLNDYRISHLQILTDFEYSKMSITLAVPVRRDSNFVLAAARGRSSPLQLGVEEVILGPVSEAFLHTTLQKMVAKITSTLSCSEELLPRAAASTKFEACRTGTARVIDTFGYSKSVNICNSEILWSFRPLEFDSEAISRGL